MAAVFQAFQLSGFSTKISADITKHNFLKNQVTVIYVPKNDKELTV